LEFCLDADFFEFAAADESGRIERIPYLKQAAGDSRSGALRKLLELFERITRCRSGIARTPARRFFQTDTDQQNALSIVQGLRSFHPSAG
jgi:hypothetical protein